MTYSKNYCDNDAGRAAKQVELLERIVILLEQLLRVPHDQA